MCEFILEFAFFLLLLWGSLRNFQIRRLRQINGNKQQRTNEQTTIPWYKAIETADC
jgi:hypothetical protein